MTTGEEHPRSILGNDSTGRPPEGSAPSRRDPDHPYPPSAGQQPHDPRDPRHSPPALDPRRLARANQVDPRQRSGQPPSQYSGQGGQQQDPYHRSAPTGQHWPGEPFGTPPSPLRGTGELQRRPFTPITGQVPVATGRPKVDRLLGRAYRWRAAAGVLLALVMTLTIAVAYRTATGAGGNEVESVAASTTTAVPSSLDEVTDFGSEPVTTPSEVPSSDPPLAPETEAPVTTAGTTEAPASTEPSATATSSETSTSATTEVPPADDPSSSTSAEVDAVVAQCAAPEPPEGASRLEAETGTPLGSASARADHPGFTGTGYIGEIIIEGAGIEFAVEANSGGPRHLTVCYAAGDVPALPDPPRTITLTVNDRPGRQLVLDQIGDWSQWWVANVGPVELAEGTNTISLTWAAGDTGWVNLDWIELGPPPPAG